MLDTYARSIYQRYCVDFLTPRLARYTTANNITLIAGFFGILVLPALWLHYSLLALLFLLISGYADTLDGSVARYRQQATPGGSLLDITLDRMVECAVILGLFFYDAHTRGIYCLLMLASTLICITSFLGVAIFTSNQSEKSFHYSPGLIERAETFIFFSAMIIIPKYFNQLALLFTGLVLLTAYRRVTQFIRHTERAPSP